MITKTNETIFSTGIAGQLNFRHATPDVEALVIENFQSETQNVENHNHYHKERGQAVNKIGRNHNNEQTFKEENCIHYWLFPFFNDSFDFAHFLFLVWSFLSPCYVLFITWEGKNVIVKENVTDTVKEALVKHL